jgi:hypothetical protein
VWPADLKRHLKSSSSHIHLPQAAAATAIHAYPRAAAVAAAIHTDHNMSDIVYESPEKDGFFTSGCSRDHTGEWMVPRHEIVQIVYIRNVKCVRIVGLYHVIRFFCLP